MAVPKAPTCIHIATTKKLRRLETNETGKVVRRCPSTSLTEPAGMILPAQRKSRSHSQEARFLATATARQLCLAALSLPPSPRVWDLAARQQAAHQHRHKPILPPCRSLAMPATQSPAEFILCPFGRRKNGKNLSEGVTRSFDEVCLHVQARASINKEG